MGQFLAPQFAQTNRTSTNMSLDSTPYNSASRLGELQKAFLDLRFCMFIHYNMATYQDLEWGDDRQPLKVFNPTNLDTEQWAEAACSAGMKGGFLTTKVRGAIVHFGRFLYFLRGGLTAP